MADEPRGRVGNMVATRIVKNGEPWDGQLHWWFWCPGCDELHGYTTPRWTRTGTDDEPTFLPSLLCTFGKDNNKRCHIYLRKGVIDFLSDCTHALAGTKVPLPEPPKWLYEDQE